MQRTRTQLTEEQLLDIWSYTDRDGAAMPYLGKPTTDVPKELWTDPTLHPALLPVPLPFGLLDKHIRATVTLWLMENVKPMPPYNCWSPQLPSTEKAVYVHASDLVGMVEAVTGIKLVNTQLQEALLTFGIEPWDMATDTDWVYRLFRDSPCASLLPDGNDNSLYVSGVMLQQDNTHCDEQPE